MATLFHRTFVSMSAFIVLWMIAIIPQGHADLGDTIPGAPAFNNPVYCIATQADGKIIVGGNFDTVNGVTRNHIARFSANFGTMDAFDPNTNGSVRVVAVQMDGKILISGDFTTVGGVTRNRMARLNADGTLDGSFDPTLNFWPCVIAIQDDGKILIGGFFTTVGGVSQPYLARLTSSGALDTSYTPVLDQGVTTASLQTNGDLVVCGSFTSVNSTTRTRMARLDSSGTLDATFNPDVNGPAESIAIRPDGRILIGKGFNYIASTYVGGVALLDATTGALDTTNFYYGSASAGELALQANGKILINHGITIARYDAEGYLDSGYPGVNVGASHTIECMMLSNERLTIGGFFLNPNPPSDHLAQFEHDSSTSSLTLPTSSSARWLRDGNIKEVQQVVFQHSTDGGSTWTDLSSGTRISGGWEMTGITIPTTGLLRATGRTGNSGTGSPSLNAATVTLTPTLRVKTNNLVTGTTFWIDDGYSTPSEYDLTHFGQVDHVGGSKEHVFKLFNNSAHPLTVSAINITGPDAADFVTGGISLPVVIPGFGESSYTVNFQPSALGTRSAVMEITSTDPAAIPYDIAVQGTGISPDPELKFSGISIVDGDSTPDSGDGTLFANTQVVSGTTTQTFTLANTGTQALRVTNILCEGGHAADFNVSPVGFNLPFDLSAGNSCTFQVTFDPSDLGTRSTTLKVLSNDGTKAIYDVALAGEGLAPQMQVSGLGVTIPDGATSASVLNGTHYGDVVIGSHLERTFTIQNTGNVTLQITNTSVIGVSDFSIIGSGVYSVSPGATANVIVRFTPLVATDRLATLRFTTNRLDSYYDFRLRGFGRLAEIDVRANAVAILDNQTSISESFLTQFGKCATVGDTASSVFTIRNTGNMALTITSVGLDTNTHFTIDASAVPPSIAPGGSAPFTVTYDPSAAGSHTDTVRIQSDDADEADFDFAIAGLAVVSAAVVTTFNPAPSGLIYSTAVQPDGKHLVGGLHATIGGSSTQARISRLLADTTSSLDSGFIPPVLASGDNVYCSAVLPDGKILIGGNFSFTASGKTWNRLVRLNADGTLDTSFVVPATGTPPNPSLPVNAIAIQKDGRILIAGQFATVSGSTSTRIARLNTDSSLDTTFVSPNPSAEVWSIALTDDEKIVIAGAFVNLGGTKDYVALLDSSGAVETGFTANANAVVNSVAIQSDGQIILGGGFTTVNSIGRTRLAQVSGTDGSLGTFLAPSITAGNVYTSVIQADQKIIAGGSFTTPYNRIARFNSGGTADSGFNPNVSSASAVVYGLSLHQDGTLLTGGSFTTIGGQTRTNLALVDNGRATETLNVTNNATRVEWLRSGTAAETTQVIFERWTGTTWVPLVGGTGAGTRIGTSSNWEITGVSLPQNSTSTIRARARTHGGRANGSSGLVTDQISYYSSFTPGPQPNIAVSNAAGTLLTDGTSVEDFGTVYFFTGTTAAPRTKTYTIRNTGTATLSGLSIPLPTGAHAADFIAGALSNTTLAPNETATFTVGFVASAAGTRTASLQIDSNVTGTRSPFNISLTGNTSTTSFDVVYTTGAEVGLTAVTFNGTGKTINLGLDHVPQAGANLSVVDITGLAFITAPFTNVAHGDTVTLTYNGVNYEYIADYYGGTGNDFELVWKFGRRAAWGINEVTLSGTRYGNGETASRGLPWPISLSGDFAGKTILRASLSENHTLAVCSDGSVLAWGENNNGQLGNNSTTDSDTPVLVNAASGVSALYNKKVIAVAAASSHSLALCSDGTVVAWGYNGFGALGTNSTTASLVPVLVNKTNGISALYNKTVVAIDAGGSFSVALCSDGTLASWGYNYQGNLGDNSTTHKYAPVLVDRTTGSALNAKTVVAISVGSDHCLALRSDGLVVSWGYNNNGQLGEGTTTDRIRPVLVNSLTGSSLYLKKATAISAGLNHSLALCEDGSIASWGSNGYGTLGDGTTTPSRKEIPTTVSTASGTSALHGKTAVDVAAYFDFSVALCSDGTAASWGRNDLYNRLGNNKGDQLNRATPVSLSRQALGSKEHFASLAQGPSSHGMILTRGSPSSAFVILSLFHNGVYEPNEIVSIGGQTEFSVMNTGTAALTLDLRSIPPGGSHSFTESLSSSLNPGEISTTIMYSNPNYPGPFPYTVLFQYDGSNFFPLRLAY